MPEAFAALLAERVRHVRSGASLGPPVPLRRRPTVSVVVPCYNYGRYLPGVVASALDQPGIDVEVVIVDDASPDGSVTVAYELAARFPQVRVIAHERNRGHIATYNDGFAAVSGDYWALVSADDVVAPGALSRAAAVLDDDPRVGMVYGAVQTFSEQPPAPRGRWTATATWTGSAWITRTVQRGTNLIASPEVVVRTSVQREVGGYRADLPHAGDLEMWLRVATVADVARVVGVDQGCYRLHDAAMHVATYAQSDGSGIVIDVRQRQAAFDAWFEFARGHVEGARALWQASRRRLAAECLERAARRMPFSARRGGLGPEPPGGCVSPRISAATCCTGRSRRVGRPGPASRPGPAGGTAQLRRRAPAPARRAAPRSVPDGASGRPANARARAAAAARAPHAARAVR